jgi:Mce-associated membrane protein
VNDASTHSPRRRNLATALAVLCVLALAGTVALGVWLIGATQESSQEAAERADVVQAAERFTETWNTFEADKAEEYVEQVAPLLSTKFRKEFQDSAENVLAGIQQQQLSSKGEVLVDEEGIPLVGIASMDGDSAKVLVVSDAARVASGQEVLRHWRWQVSLIQVDGKWLVDEFEEV